MLLARTHAQKLRPYCAMAELAIEKGRIEKCIGSLAGGYCRRYAKEAQGLRVGEWLHFSSPQTSLRTPMDRRYNFHILALSDYPLIRFLPCNVSRTRLSLLRDLFGLCQKQG